MLQSVGGTSSAGSLTAAQIAALAEATRIKKAAELAAAKKAAGLVVVAPPKPSPPPPTPAPTPASTPKTNVNPGAQPAVVPPQTVYSSPIPNMSPNVFQAYVDEIKRLTLKLVKNSKDLLLAYDFQSINSASDYYLDTDNAAKTYASIVKKAVPKPNFDLNQLSLQEATNNLVNQLVTYLSDFASDTTKNSYFGSYSVDGGWNPGTPSFSGTEPKYDLRVLIPVVGSEITNINISLYEI